MYTLNSIGLNSLHDQHDMHASFAAVKRVHEATEMQATEL